MGGRRRGESGEGGGREREGEGDGSLVVMDAERGGGGRFTSGDGCIYTWL